MSDLDDNIAAIASPPGGAARGIVRLSGPSVEQCLTGLFQPAGDVALQEVERATVLPGVFLCGELSAPLPCDVYFWPDGRSYTRQPMIEIHTLGSPPLLECVLGAVCAQGARVADPGEFTLRAFLSGRLDLTQAEAVLGVIDAGDSREFNVALQQLAGGVGGAMTTLRDQLLDLLAHLEAGLDFVEEDIEFISANELNAVLSEAAASVQRLAEQMASRAQSTEFVRVVLWGWPNVGKSSLFNALLENDKALVSKSPGTTRDYLIGEMDINGIRFQLIDTAGAEVHVGEREELDHEHVRAIDAAAGRQAASQREQGQVRLLCLDSSRRVNEWEQSRLDESETFDLVVLTKSDCRRQIDVELPAAVTTSARTGAGLKRLRQELSEAAAHRHRGETAVVASTAARCRESLRLAAECIDRARALVVASAGEELVAAEIRVSLTELGKIVGTVYTDDILDRIFSRFCIGK